MKQKAWALLLAASIFPAQAHRVWVASEHTHGGEILKASLGYGEFPHFEPIPEGRKAIFSSGMQLVTAEGVQDLLQKGEHNYQYQSASPLAEGSYMLAAVYKPTYWSKNAQGWKQQNLKEMQDGSYCEQTRMYGKNIVNVGHHSADTQVITRPLGHELEIVPLDNPANVQVGERFPVRILLHGEPLPQATLTATFEGFDPSDHSQTHKIEAQAFSDTSDKDGVVSIIPLRQGFWKAMVTHKSAYPDASVCQHWAAYSTLTFEIGAHHH